jgi:hypothetical protein
MKLSHFYLPLIASSMLFAEQECDDGGVPDRRNALPVEHIEDASDTYLEGYIQALVDAHYYEFKVLVVVKDRAVYLYNLPNNELISGSIASFVRDVPGVCSVQVMNCCCADEKAQVKKQCEKPQVDGIWFPQSTVLFLPLVADPRQPVNSMNLRIDDRVLGHLVGAVSLGDDFPIFRWRDVFWWKGDLQISIEGGIWAVFNFSDVPDHGNGDTCELINTDYFFGIPLTYAFDRWSFRLRPYHISSHLGDEFLCNNQEEVDRRKNPSFEAVDFFVSYQFSSGLRAYVGPGVVVHSDKSFTMKPLYIEYGAEIRLFGRKLYYHKLYGTPFFAMHLENWQERGWSLDQTYKVGYEWSKLQGIGRKMRLYADYHQGYSYEGQFFNKKTKYVEFGFSWGF